jgi:hypothetical protein
VPRTEQQSEVIAANGCPVTWRRFGEVLTGEPCVHRSGRHGLRGDAVAVCDDERAVHRPVVEICNERRGAAEVPTVFYCTLQELARRAF